MQGGDSARRAHRVDRTVFSTARGKDRKITGERYRKGKCSGENPTTRTTPTMRSIPQGVAL